MFKKLSLASAVLALSATALVPTTAATAQRYDRGYENSDYGRDYRDGYQDYRQDYRQDGRSGYRNSDRRYYNQRNYRANQKCRDGDGGTIIGAIAGGLLGRSIAGRGDHVLGTILGGVGGAVAGRAIDRSDRPDYCRR